MTATARRQPSRRARRPHDPANLVEVDDLKVHFPIRAGHLQDRARARSRPSTASTFEVRRGETLGLVGESGCGKSTIGRAMIRLRDATSGHGPLRRRRPRRASSRRAAQDAPPDADHLPGPVRVARPADDGRLDHREPIETHNLAEGEAKDERVAELLRLVGLDPKYVKRYPHEFSGGQRQRIGVARALAVEPEFIVCDEPISALDVSIQAQVLNLLTDLRTRLGLTYLFVAHDLSVVKHISDRVAVMYLGKIVEIGPPDAALRARRATRTRGPCCRPCRSPTRSPSGSASGSSSRATCRARSTRRPAAASTPAAGCTSAWASRRTAGRSTRRSTMVADDGRPRGGLPLRRRGAQDRRRDRPHRRRPVRRGTPASALASLAAEQGHDRARAASSRRRPSRTCPRATATSQRHGRVLRRRTRPRPIHRRTDSTRSEERRTAVGSCRVRPWKSHGILSRVRVIHHPSGVAQWRWRRTHNQEEEQ